LAEKIPREAILVVGTHRSGTSVFTGLLQLAGVYLGDDLLEAQPDNPRGFFEHRGVYEIHETLLRHLGSGWYDIRSLPDGWTSTDHAVTATEQILAILAGSHFGSPPWGIKDPRICRLLPLWKQILVDQGMRGCYVHCLRHPFEVAESLARRNRIPLTYSVLLWLSRVLEAEEHTRGETRAFVTYDRVVTDPVGVIASLSEDLSIDFPVPPSELTRLAEDFVSDDLRHHGAGHSSLSRASFGADQLYELACACYELMASEGEADSSISAERMDELRAAYRHLLATTGEGVVSGWSQTMGRRLQAEAEVGALERALEEIRQNLEARSKNLADTQEALGTTSKSLAETQEVLAATSRKLAESQETLEVTRKEHTEIQETLDATRETFVFRMTAPLRKLERWLTERR
jgi:hypothetical protein